MDFSSDFQEENKLDSDFRQILCIIKHYIQYVNSNHQLQLYRSWLEKLSMATEEKAARNMYLFELARQIKCNRLLPPFDHHPPLGSLESLPKINFFRPSELENSFCDSREHIGYLYPESIPPPNEIIEQNYPQSQFLDQINRNQPPQSQSPCEFQTLFVQSPECYYHPCYAEDGSDTPDERVKTPTKIKRRKSNSARRASLQKLAAVNNVSKSIINEQYKNEDGKGLKPADKQEVCFQKETGMEELTLKDDSSWCDLTDTSQTSVNIMASGDNRKRLPKVQEKVKQFNGNSDTEKPQLLNNTKKSHQNLRDKNQLHLSDQIEKPCSKNQNFNEVKVSLKDTNFISSDWKKTIEGLQLRLTETLNQNNELKSIINALQLKLKEETSKNKEQNDSKQKKTELRKREIEALQQIQMDNIKKLEKSFHAKLNEAERSYQQKIDKLKANYEVKIKELQGKNQYSKKEKDQEMCRLSEIIQQQCIRMSNEIAALRNQIENAFCNFNGDDKIIVLQKCVSKMDKLFQRSEKEYLKQIEKLKQELDIKDKVMQIQLKTQRAELITRTSVEKQKQFDEVINNLEIKYMKMLEYHESQINEIKGQDEEKIQRLMQLLEENHIVCDNFL